VPNLRLVREFLGKVAMPWSYGYAWYFLDWNHVAPVTVFHTIHDMMDRGGWQLLEMPERDLSPFNQYWVLLPFLRDIKKWLDVLPRRDQVAMATLDCFPCSHLILYRYMYEWHFYFLQCPYDSPIGRQITVEFLQTRCRWLLGWAVNYLHAAPNFHRRFYLNLLPYLGEMVFCADAAKEAGIASNWTYNFDE